VGFDSTLTVRPTATAPALLLRPWTEQDIPAMVEAHRDPVMRQWLRHPVRNADEARRARAKLATGSRPPHAGEASHREPSMSYASGSSACRGADRWKGWNLSTASATALPAG
jgi:hypothetical protein